MAATTRTCAYDRAGRGSSDPRGRSHRRRRRRRPARRCWRPPASRRRSWSSGTRSARSTRGSSPIGSATTWPAWCWSTASGSTSRPTAIHPLLGEPAAASTRVGRRGCADMVAGVEDLDWPTSEQQLRDADVSGVPVVVLRAPRGEPRLDDATNEAIATAWESAYGWAVARQRALRDRLGRRPRHPGRPPRPGHRRGAGSWSPASRGE